MDLQLSHRKALVLGASRGIGAAIVSAFLQEGAQVHAVARGAQGLAELPASPRLSRHAIDLTQPGALAQALPAIGPIDHLVLCVSALATAQPGDWQAAWQDTWHTDILATLSAIEDCLPWLQGSDAASIVYVGSRASQVQAPGSEAYGAGKAALNMLTRDLAGEFAPLVRVNAILVGGVATQGLEVVLTDDALRAQFEANTPMRRPGTPRDIACAALYLASPASSWVTGSLMKVDGGVERPAIDVPAPPLVPSAPSAPS